MASVEQIGSTYISKFDSVPRIILWTYRHSVFWEPHFLHCYYGLWPIPMRREESLRRSLQLLAGHFLLNTRVRVVPHHCT